MSLDLLKKLVKLANHNPNDNEANSAARRVCLLLEEFNFFEKKADPLYDKFRSKQEVYYKKTQKTNSIYDTMAVFCEKCNRPTVITKQEYYSGEKIYCEDCKKNPNIFKRKCIKCGVLADTKFNGPEFLFLCEDCGWR